MPSASDAALLDFLVQVVNVPESRIKRFNASVEVLRNLLRERVAADGEFAMEDIYSSGSMAKGTAIHPPGDVDIAVHLRPENVATRDVLRVMNYVHALLCDLYPGKAEADFSKGTHAVRARFHGADLEVDVVPVIRNAGPNGTDAVLNCRTGEWITTSIPTHIRFVEGIVADHPHFRQLVLLTKQWRRVAEVRMKSFALELLWAHALRENEVTATDLGEAMLQFFAYVVHSGLRDPIQFAREDGTLPDVPAGAVVILDPANPTNNVTGRMDDAQRQGFLEACRTALENLATAQTAGTPAVARRYYRRVFGSDFPLECKPEDSGHPEGPAGELAAKIHSDLRQLRVRCGGFGTDHEENTAADLRMWIQSGYAEDIEIGYYDPSTNERRLVVAYRVTTEPGVVEGHEPGGLRGAPCGGSFQVHVTGTERWRTLPKEERSEFYGRLSLGWGSGKPIPESAGEWLPDRTYRAGALGMRRSQHVPVSS